MRRRGARRVTSTDVIGRLIRTTGRRLRDHRSAALAQGEPALERRTRLAHHARDDLGGRRQVADQVDRLARPYDRRRDVPGLGGCPVALLFAPRFALCSSASRPCQRSLSRFASARPVKRAGQSSPRTRSNTVVRSVASPSPSTSRALAAGWPSASLGGVEPGPDEHACGAEHERRGQAPAVGDPARGGDRRRGDRVDHRRHERQSRPLRAMAAGLRALRDDDLGAERGRGVRVGERLHLQDQLAPAALRIEGTNGAGSPNESMTAAGLRASATCSRSG